ncbi:MAG TPA: hypothetical protein VLX92_19975 [Kofleriaceae bacterium]|nr:hypothetical protein [Kofleriaceae bacterium]
MRLALLVALAGCTADPPRPPAPAPAPPEPRNTDLDRWEWEHTSPKLDRAAQRAEIDRQQADDAREAKRRAQPTPYGDGPTHLQVMVLDDYVWTECHPGDHHALEVLLDGASRGSVDVPCTTTMQSPPRAYQLPVFEVAHGIHRIRVREAATGVTAVRDFVFPDGDGDTLRVWASERALRIDDLSSHGELML